MSAEPFRAAQATADHWGAAAKSCLEALGSAQGDNIGFLYVTPAFADDLTSIVTFLSETTSVRAWVGGIGHAVWGPDGVITGGTGGLTVLLGRLPSHALRLYDGGDLSAHSEWLALHQPAVALVHANPQAPDMVSALAEMEQSNVFLVGGLTAGPAIASAGRHCGKAVCGVLLGPEAAVLTGLAQGCQPIGPLHEVTEAMAEVVVSLDGQPALEVLKQDAGQVIARDLRKAAGYIHAGLPVPGSDTGDYVVRNLMGIDPRRGWIAVGAELAAGDRMMFVRRDPNTARTDFLDMLSNLKTRLDGKPIRGAVYVSCVARGAHMFGEDDRELAMIRDRLGEFPLIGFSAGGEIHAGRLYAYTGILMVLT